MAKGKKVGQVKIDLMRWLRGSRVSLQLQLQLQLPRFMPRQLRLVLLSMDLNLARDPLAWDRTDPERDQNGNTGRMSNTV